MNTPSVSSYAALAAPSCILGHYSELGSTPLAPNYLDFALGGLPGESS